MDHADDDTEFAHAVSSQTVQGDEELESAELMTEDHLDDDTQLFRAGSSPTDLSDDELDRAERRLRLELLASIFADKPVQLKDIEPPSECYGFPDHGKDIFFQYLHSTVFHVKVWINFDGHEGVFFEGARSAACGKLQLPEHVYKVLDSIEPGAIKFQHVCFEIGTPFRTLATVDLTVELAPDGTSQVRAELALGYDDERRLNGYLKRACRQTQYNGVTGGVDSLAFQDLEDFALLFRRDREVSPGRDKDWEEPAYGGGEWAGVEDHYQTTPSTPTRRYTRILW